MRLFIITITALCVFTFSAHSAEPLVLNSKNWRIIDGDTIYVDDYKIRLIGIEAPERTQNCRDADGKKWACGKRAGDAVREILEKHGQGIQCTILGGGYYGRLLGECFSGDSGDGVDLQKMLVRQGLALSSRGRYDDEEIHAQTQCLGMWAGAFAEPKDWRNGNRRMHDRAPEHCP